MNDRHRFSVTHVIGSVFEVYQNSESYGKNSVEIDEYF
jgi:hypothetical protein